MADDIKAGIVYIDILKLRPHPDNPRKDLGDLTELSDSIKAKGILQNLTVIPDGEYYTILIGHRRAAAAKLAGIKQVPCVVAEMNYPEQIQTMLLENMQRSELTAFEQAQGFQMMFDFGNSVEDIAEKTGFSETTVRRRLKLAELDKEKLKKASARQISLFEFDKLSKIEDTNERNKLLDSIGTNNFERDIKCAFEKQEQIRSETEWRAELTEEGLKEISYSDCFNGKYALTVKSYVEMKGKSVKAFVLSGDEEYFAFNHNVVYFRKRKSKEECEDDYRRNQEREKRYATKHNLEAAEQRAYQLRRDFILGISEAIAKEKTQIIIEYDVRINWDVNISGYYTIYDKSIFGTDAIEKAKQSPFKALLLHVYARLGDSRNIGYSEYSGRHQDNLKLNLIYCFLELLGYEMSDEERELKDGTSSLFCGD